MMKLICGSMLGDFAVVPGWRGGGFCPHEFYPSGRRPCWVGVDLEN
ncbi:MAG: hypothetical protein LBQ66_10260 [Planctomycetaceae bacterium]|nr:hypothetical protein [Planctomycetaceae bacterium]